MGMKTLELTMSLDSIEICPCIQILEVLVKASEIDALGGEMALLLIPYTNRMLLKGPAVHSLRVQADKKIS